MSRLVKLKGPKFWRGPQATKKSLRPTSILWLCHQTEPHFRHSLTRLEVHCGVPAALEGKATTTCQLLSCLEPGTRQTLRPTAWNTPDCLQSGAHFRDATFTGGWGDLALPSPHGATPLGATATPSTNRKRRRSQCSSELTPRVVTANSPGKVVESGGHSLLAAVHWPRTQNSTQLGSVNLVLSHCGAPHTDAVSRAAVGKRLSLALCSRAARKWGYYLEIQLSSRALCGSFPGQGPVIINSWSKFDRNNKNE